MDSNDEVKILQDVMKQMEDPEAALQRQKKVKQGVYSAGSFGLVAAGLLALGDIGPAWMSALLAGAAGLAGGLAIMHGQVLRQWPVTLQYVDVARIRARLAQLQAED